MLLQILFDFARRYSDANDGALLTSWPTYKVDLPTILQTKYESSIHSMWSGDVETLLISLKLNPNKANARNLLTAASFNKAIGKTHDMQNTVFYSVCMLLDKFCHLHSAIPNENQMLNNVKIFQLKISEERNCN